MTSVARRRPKNTATHERGQALLELIPVMLLLLTLTFAVIDFGRAIWQLQVITGLTREGSNLASRNTTLPDAATAVINDGKALNLKGKDSSGNGLGKVIVTSVQNQGDAANPSFVIMDQTSIGTLSATSKINGPITSTGVKTAILPTVPATGITIPQPGDTIYVTEIYSLYSAITPLGSFVNYAIPKTLYDVAYF